MAYRGRGPPGPSSSDGYGMYGGYRGPGDFPGPPPSFPPYGHGYGPGPGDIYARQDIPPPGRPGLPPPPLGPSYGSSYDRPAISDRLGPPVDLPPYSGYRPGGDSARGLYSNPDDKKYTSASSEMVSRDYGHGNIDDSQDYKPSSKSDGRGGSGSQQASINLDALLQDERLKNVLFAGISKATAKLEQSLNPLGDNTPENVAFLSDSMKNMPSQLFPAASSSTEPSSRPKSILKKKSGSGGGGGVDENDSSHDPLSKLSALEKTLQLLRGKPTTSDAPGSEKGSQDRSRQSVAAKGALGQLASYDDGGGEDEESYLYDKSDRHEKLSQPAGKHAGTPFWSVDAIPPASETLKREKDTFDIQDKLYEQWRQSINRDSQEPSRNDQSIPQVDPFFQKKIPAQMAAIASQAMQEAEKDNEELDSTVQNILQSIGFNFDLSKRMQELAKQKKKQQDELQTGIVDQSASFLDQGGNLVEEVRASLFKNEQEKTSIENLIKEARASSQKNRSSYERSSSPSKWSDRGSRERGHAQDKPSHHRDRSPGAGSSDRYRSSVRSSPERYDARDRRSQERSRHRGSWEEISPQREDEWDRPGSRRREDGRLSYERGGERRQRSLSQERRAATPPQSRYLDDPGWTSHKKLSDRHNGSRISERLRDEPKDEYFYPEDNDYTESPPAMPLLTSFSSRRKEEDLSSGLFPSKKLYTQARPPVENLRVMSRAVDDDDDVESFTQSRRIILPAKSERRVVSKSPTYRGSRSPDMKYSQKRSASPLISRVSKERRLDSERVEYYERDRDGYYGQDYHHQDRPQSPGFDRSMNEQFHDRRGSSDGYRTASHRSEQYYMSSPPGGSSDRVRDMSPRQHMLEDPEQTYDEYHSAIGRMEEVRRYSPEKAKSPARDDYYEKESRNYDKESRKKTPERQSSRSGARHRSRSRDRRRSRSPHHRRSRSRSDDRRRRSPERRRSPGRERRRSPARRRSADRRKSPGRKQTSGKYKDSKSSSGTKPGQSRFKLDRRDKPQELPKIDVSKLAPAVRKAYLQKLLEEKNTNVDDAKVNLLAAIEQLASISPEERKNLLVKMTVVSAEERQKMMQNLSMRQIKVSALNLELEKLKKEQNELMRKCQRSGLGTNDPMLVQNAKAQESLEKEIKRLSAADFHVSLEEPAPPPKSSPPPSHARDESSKPTATGPKGKPTSAAPQKPSSSEAVRKNDKGSWKSVTVKADEGLPDIGEPVKKEETSEKDKAKNQEGNRKASRDNSTSQTSGGKKVYYEYYDSGNHWCKYCSVSCNALEQLFQHSHGKKHLNCIEHEKRPWKDSKKEQKTPAKKFGVAQSRRIKGAELMFPVVGFYCTLCKVFCGDFIESTDHLKTDGHYDKYTEFVKLNPMYEKKLLLEKAAGLTAKKHTETVTQPPPPPTPPPPPKSSEKKAGTKQTHSNKAQTPSDKDQAPKTKSVKKHLRVTGKTSNAESDDESKEKDNIEVVDMELDDEEEESVSVVKSKVPKLTGKPSGVLPPWTSLPSSGKSSMVDMKETKEDDNQPLDTFLNIKVDKKEDKKTELPVVVGPELDLSVIPIPDLLDIPIPEGPSLFGKSEACESSQVSTVKSLQEVQAEEKRQMDEEKRMMGIDVDAEEEKPLSAIPVPPPSVADVPLPKDPIPDEKDSTKKSKPKSLDTLFAKLNKNVSCRPKPKPTVQSETVPEMEQKIQEEIRARLEREKIKLLRQKQKKEMKEKKAEDGWVKKKRIESDTSSSEESDDSDESQNTIDKEGTESQAGLANEATAHSGEGVESGAPSDTVSSHVQVGDEQVTQTEEKQKTQFEEEQVTQIEEKQKTQTEEEQVTQTGEKQKTQMEEGQITQTEEEQKSQTGEEQVAQTGDDQKNAPQDKENAKADETGKNETHDTEMKVASQEENVIEGKESQNSSETMSPVKETLHTAVENEASYEKADATKSFKEKTPSKSEVKTKKGIPKGKVTAKMTDDYSDISAFLVSSEDSAINLADRSIVAKKAGAKKTPKKAATAVSRSGKRVTRGSKQKEEATEEGDDIAKLMLDGGMIVLSEVTDEEEDQDMSEDQLVEVQESQDHEDDIQDKSLMQKPESGNAENDESAKNVSQNRDNEESIFITVEPSCSDAKEEPQDLDEANESKDSECIAHAVEVEQPQELDEIAEVSSSSRGRGRGKKAGGRGRGRGRRATAVAQAKIEAQIGAAVFDVDDNLVPTSDGDVTRQQDSASAESFPLSSPSEEHQHADMNAPSEEEPSPTRQTRSRRGGTTRRGRGRGRQTRSRTRKEEEDLHVDSDEVMDIEMVSADEKSLKTGTGHSHDEEGFSMDIENLECQARPEGEQVKSVQQEMIDNANFKDSIYEQGSQSETMLQPPNPDSTTKHTGAQISLDVGAGDLVQPTVVANIEPGKEDLLSLQASAEMDSPVQSLPVGSSEGEADRSMFSLMSDGEKSIEGSLTHSAISKPQNADDSDSEATITEETEDPALLPLPDFADSIDSIADTAGPPTDDFESVDETDSGLQELPQKIGSDVHGDKSSEAQPAASEALPELQDNSEYGCVASSTSTTLDVDKKTSVDAEDTVTNVASQDTSINVDQKDSSADVAIEEAQAPGTPPQPSHGHSSGQGRDPPMSGVVSEVEETMDSMMMSVNEQSGEELESEAPPTAGLSLGLEEDEDSMEFTMVGMEDKMDAEDE